ncbi:unnamed protein product [Gongylonema pulchrum]|uniref:Uncharacterized protein n=1 Tax=Gongylonema pulchrum TaxID=637853 RepID=A0A3P6TII3_9BILA|nr:unnamed protein product [Gongylonema pulchrum]
MQRQPLAIFQLSDTYHCLFLIALGHQFATYDENWNHVTLQNKVANYFSNFPLEPIRGLLNTGPNMLLFGDKAVYKYDKDGTKMIGDATPLKTFFRCQRQN